MESDNPTGADNQQETASSCEVLDPNWIVGFVDGEGCFCVSVHRSSMMRRHGGWQLQPVFHFYQHHDHRDVLEAMIPVFGFERLVRIAYGMNANGKQRARTLEQVLAGCSETARRAPTGESRYG